MLDHEGERPLERVLWPRAERRRPPRPAAFGGERPGKVLRRPRAAHPRRGRPRLRARRRLVVLRVPARRPLQPRDSRLLVRAAQGRAAGQGRLLERGVPAHRHRGLPRRQGGPEFCNGDVDALLSAFGIERSVSRPGNPCDNAVVESTNRALKRELVRGRAFPSEDRLRTELFDWVNWCNSCRLHSTLGYMTPAGFREAGLILS